jgi:Uma2 family endonuclease
MTTTLASPNATTPGRAFQAGTTGWTVKDLLDPEIAFLWDQGRYEIIEGVLTLMPAASFFGNLRANRLVRLIELYLGPGKEKGEFAFEIDVALSSDRLVRADAVFLTTEAARRQREAVRQRGDFENEFAPLFVPPTLVIESLSRGHERHDRVTKRGWYAAAGIPHYWLLNSLDRTLECLVLEGESYRVDQAGKESDVLRPAAFPGLVIPLAEVWKD